jgi:hypothetical protein
VAKGRDRGAGTGGPLAGDDAEHLVGRVVPKLVIALRERDVHGQGILVGPGLELASLILPILLYLEGGDDHNPHRDRTGILRSG